MKVWLTDCPAKEYRCDHLKVALGSLHLFLEGRCIRRLMKFEVLDE